MAFRELDQRETECERITLFWHAESDDITVLVEDMETGDDLLLEGVPHDIVMDVFHDPYAYRAVADMSQFN